jgi:hypothetical protein
MDRKSYSNDTLETVGSGSSVRKFRFRASLLTIACWFLVFPESVGCVASINDERKTHADSSNEYTGQGFNEPSPTMRVCMEKEECARKGSFEGNAEEQGWDERMVLKVLESWSCESNSKGRPLLIIRPQYGLGNRQDTH